MLRAHRTRNLIRIGGGLLVGAVCLWLSFRGVPLAAVAAAAGHSSVLYTLLAVAGVLLVASLKALRWQWLFPPSTPAPRWTVTFGILMTGQMLNLLVPIRLGEVARLGLMRQEGVPVGATLGTIFVEKSLDLVAVGLLVVLAIPLATLPPSLGLGAGIGGLLLAVVLLAALFLIGHFRVPLLALFQRVPEPQQHLAARLHRNLLRLASTALDSLAVLEGPRLAPVLGLTALVWLLSVAGMLAMLAAFGLPVDVRMALVLMLGVTSANWVPTPPALIGVIGAVAVAALAPFGVAHESALALGAILNLVLVVPPVVLGTWAVWTRLLLLREVMAHTGWRHALGLAHPLRSGDPSRPGGQP